MALVKNISGEDRIVQGRLVLASSDLEVPADEVYGYTCQEPNWAPADDEAQAAHDAAAKALEPDVEPSLDWTRKELDAFAAEHDIDVSGASNKGEVLDLINKQLEG